MAKLQFRCPQCHAIVRASEDEAGSAGRCPACGHVSIIPSPAKHQPDQPARVPTALTDITDPRQEVDPEADTRVACLLDRLVGAITLSSVGPDRAKGYSAATSRAASYAVILTGIVYTACLVVSAIKADSLLILATAVAAFVATFLLHYLAACFARLARDMSYASQAACSPLLSRTVALLSGFSAIGTLVVGLTEAVQASSLTPMWPTLMLTIALAHVAVVSANPASFLGMQVDSRRTVDAVFASFGEFACRLVLASGWIMLVAIGPLAALWMLVAVITLLVGNGAWHVYLSVHTAAYIAAAGAISPCVTCTLYLGLRAVLAVFQRALAAVSGPVSGAGG